MVPLVHAQCSPLCYLQLEEGGLCVRTVVVLFAVVSHTACVILALIQQDP